MNAAHLLAASILAFSSAVLSASCIQDPTAAPEAESVQEQRSNGTEPIGEAEQEARGPLFTPAEFIFVIEREWDGKDEAGGWQIAYDTPSFAVVPKGTRAALYTWQCRLLIGMPRHAEKVGDIPTNRAAALSAEIANAVVWPLLERQESWAGQGETFCDEFREGMNLLFKKRYRSVGARVAKP
jgi:hypothetical protein